MATSGENAVHEIQADLACPQCQYNLRGLRGDVVSCPECGARCDVAKLILVRWEKRKPWQAPLSGLLWIPVVWIVLSLLVIGNIGVRQTEGWYARHSPFSIPPLVWPWVALAAAIAVWLVLLWYVHKRFGTFQGVKLSLLQHLGFVLMSTAMLGVLACGIIVISILAEVIEVIVFGDAGALRTIWKPGLLILVPLLPGTVAVLYVVDRIERYTARECIRRFVVRTADLDQPSAPAS